MRLHHMVLTVSSFLRTKLMTRPGAPVLDAAILMSVSYFVLLLVVLIWTSLYLLQTQLWP